MPNALTHYVFAKTVLENLPAVVQEKIHNQEKYYYFAAMGGDVLYGLNFSSDKVKQRYGYVAHEGLVAESFTEALNAEMSEVNYAFTLGYLTHYCLDSTMHPYIFYAEKRVGDIVGDEYRDNCHMLIEAALDLYYATEYLADPYKKTASLFKWDSDVIRATLEHYTKVTKNTYQFSMTKKDAWLAVKAWKLFAYLGTRGTAFKQWVSQTLEKALKSPHLFTAGYRPKELPQEWDVLNLEKRPYTMVVDGETVTKYDTIPELWDEALKKADNYLTTFVTARKTGGNLDALDFSINYDGNYIG